MFINKKDTTKRNKRFERLCITSQTDLKKNLVKELSVTERKVVEEDGYIYCEGILPIILCAHMDTVHKELPTEIVYEDGKISSPQGIGGDDRCGIYMIMEIIKKYPCHVIFFEDEEVGGVGSDKFAMSDTCKNLKGKINYAIELDRMNANDAVFYDCDNPDFTDFITKEFWKENYGSFTDICHICPELEIAGVNLSCGYYKQHTTSEYVVLKEMEIAIKEVKKLIARTTENDRFEWIEAKRNYYGNYFNLSRYFKNDDDDDDYYYSTKCKKQSNVRCYYICFKSEKGEDIYDIEACSEAEALGWFMMDNPDKTYNDVLDVDYEECCYY